MLIITDGNIVLVTVLSTCLNEILRVFMFIRSVIVPFRWPRGNFAGNVHYCFLNMKYSLDLAMKIGAVFQIDLSAALFGDSYPHDLLVLLFLI